MNKTSIVLITVILIVAGGYFYLRNSSPFQSAIFDGFFEGGLEGGSQIIYYRLSYSPSDFSVGSLDSSDFLGPTILLKEPDGRAHTITFFSTEGSGSMRWPDSYVKSFCSECKPVTNSITLPGVANLSTFSSNEYELILFTKKRQNFPFPVAALLQKPSDKAKKVLESLTFQVVNLPDAKEDEED